MARASKAEKAKTHEALLTVAAVQLRERGFAGLNVSDVMKAAGLTHGGFYRHFKNKEDLAVAATNRAFSVFIERLEQDLASLPAREALIRFVNRYLSIQHLKNISDGCPVAALSAEASRCSEAERTALERGTEQLVARLEIGLNPNGQGGHMTGNALIGLLSGALNLARLQSDVGRQGEILNAARQMMVTLEGFPTA